MKRRKIRMCDVCGEDLLEDEFYLCSKCRKKIIPFKGVVQ